MNAKLSYFIVTIITGLLLSSCANKMSLVKRKYNKGYYVSHSHKTNSPKEQESLALAKKDNSITKLKAGNFEPELKTANTNVEKVEAYVPETKKSANDHFKESRKVPDAVVKYTFKTIEKIAPASIQRKIALKGPDGGLVAATLSLFWIVLVVILIIYLLGLAFDGFGLGWTIHLLAVIFLVLLILWLLGVV